MAGSKGIVSSQFYKFSAANKTITFSNDYAGLDLGEIAYITNIKNGVATAIYDPFDTSKGGVLNGLTLTLAYDTTTMQDTDPLQVIVGFTPLNADPLPVTIVEGPDQKDDTDLLNRIADNLDFLNLSLDQTEGIQVNTRDANPAKRDVNNAQVASDGVETPPKYINRLNDIYLVDTTGYNTAVFTVLADANASLNFTIEGSMDGTRAYGIQFITWLSSGAAGTTQNANANITLSPNTIYVIAVHSIFKFARLRITSFTAGGATISCMLKNTIYGAGTNTGPNANILIGGSQPTLSTAGNSGTPGAAQSSAGTVSVGPAYLPTTNAVGQASTLATTVPYPFGIAGREQPYIGALSGIFRYLTVDGGGRYILGGDTPDTETRTQSKLASGAIPGIPPRGVGAVSNNIIGAQSLTVTDVAQDFGDTQVMLLRQILTELKVLNQQFAEMPQILNQANFTLSDPQEFRNDADFDSFIQ